MRVNERADNVAVDEFEVADPADTWVQAGFSVDSDSVCRVGGVQSGCPGVPRHRHRRVVVARPAVGRLAP